MSLLEWLDVQEGEQFVSECDGDTYTVKEALIDIHCRRCDEWIEKYEPYARGTWHYAKFHVFCADRGL